MSDSLPYGNRFGYPFTRDELKRALLQVHPEEEAESLVRLVYEPDQEAIGVTTTDVELLLLAALSPDVAARVVEYRPGLRQRAQVAQADPRAFVRLMRSFRRPGPPAPGADPVRGHGLADVDLLLLAVLFPDQAGSVVEHEPRLRERVREVQADPEAFARRLRSSREASSPAPGTGPVREP